MTDRQGIFADRMQVRSPGKPRVDAERLVDSPPVASVDDSAAKKLMKYQPWWAAPRAALESGKRRLPLFAAYGTNSPRTE